MGFRAYEPECRGLHCSCASVMFFPISDDNPTRQRPWLTYALIAANVVAYLVASSRELAGEYWLTTYYGLVPSRFSSDVLGEFITVVTSMFLHADLKHLGSNMWFLHIFGDNLEDVLGRWRYVAFYLAAGLGAALMQVLVDASSTIPMIGASGAIAGVVAGYLVLYPRAPILCLNGIPLLWIPLGVLVVLPAWVIAGMFFVINLLMGWLSLGSAGGGVAFFAHIGGFVVGLALIRPFLGRRQIPPRAWAGWQDARRTRFRRRP